MVGISVLRTTTPRRLQKLTRQTVVDTPFRSVDVDARRVAALETVAAKSRRLPVVPNAPAVASAAIRSM